MGPERTHDRAVSPVIGVILLVAITVLLAATAATFFINFQDEAGSTPKAGFEFEYQYDTSGDSLAIRHSGGDTLEAANLYVTVRDASGRSGGDPNGEYPYDSLGTLGGGSEVSAGVGVTMDASDVSASNPNFESATVTVVWRSPDTEQSVVLVEWTGPSA